MFEKKMKAMQVTQSQNDPNEFWIHRDEQDGANVIDTENRRN